MTCIQPNWPAPTTVKAYTTLRDTWHEKHALISLLQLPTEPVWLHQIHSNRVIPAIPEHKEHDADASFTDQAKHICIVTTADCLPLLMCNKQGSMVAAIHAGWRGLSAGIIEATLDQLQQRGEDMLVWLGPAIGPEKFEVGQDVYDAFVSQHPPSATAFTLKDKDQWLANLYELAKIRLKLQGISHIYGGNFCTYTQKELFYSYRRDKGKTGRMASLIWIASDYK